MSKKRKKDGKPVHKAHPPAVEGEHAAHPDDRPPSHPVGGGGKPSNPFVQMQQARRGAQRGR